MTDAARLRIAVVSEDLSLPIDEGLKKFVFAVTRHLSDHAGVLTISTRPEGALPPDVRHCSANRAMLGSDLNEALRSFRPDRLIYIPRAAGTRNAFARCLMLRRQAPGAKVMMVSLQQRHYGPVARRFIRRFHPDVTVSQGLKTSEELRDMGIPALAIPSGVNHEEFRPPARDERTYLRHKYGIDPDRFVVLHVGHLRRQRNVGLLGRLRQSIEAEVVMVASTSTPPDDGLGDALRRQGVKVIDRYVETVAELYQLADCYLFPVHIYYGAIEMPLSVLEAMSCGVPVVSTPFGSLPYWLQPGTGLEYADSDEELIEAVHRQQRDEQPPAQTAIRERSRAFSWPAITERLMAAFDGLDDRTSDVVTVYRTEQPEDVAQCAS